MIKISVIVSTYNRTDYLKDVLDCLLIQETNNEFDYEIIVIDNNSNDHTSELLTSYAAQNQDLLICLFEEKQGKSFALNKGIRTAKGEIISFVDDDCLLDKDYLWNINQVFESYGPDVGVLGGKISPKWIGNDYPFWLDKIFSQSIKLEDGSFNFLKICFEGTLGIFDLGKESFVLDYKQKDHPDIQFFGANMVFRKKVLEQYGGFNVDKKFDEDTEICKRLFNAGIKGVYAPEIMLYHKVPTTNATSVFFYKWWFNRGMHSEWEEKSVIGAILKTIYLPLKSLQENDLYKKIRLRWQAFFILGQMIKMIKQMVYRNK